MDDPTPEREPQSDQEWLFMMLFLFCLLGLLAAEIFANYQPVKLSIFFMLALWLPRLALHEVGHALMAWLVGWRVRQIVLGFGRTLKRFRLGATTLALRQVPLEGFVEVMPRNLQAPRLKHALIYLAGPGIELLLAAGLLAWLGADTLLQRSDEPLTIFWQSLALTAVIGGAFNLIPHAVQSPHGWLPSDGLGLLQCATRPLAVYEAILQMRDSDLQDPDE